MTEPVSAHQYDDRGAQAVYAVLLEMGQVLGAYRDKFVVIGGSVPWLLLPDADPRHIGTLDVDLSLDAAALRDDDMWGWCRRWRRQATNARRPICACFSCAAR